MGGSSGPLLWAHKLLRARSLANINPRVAGSRDELLNWPGNSSRFKHSVADELLHNSGPWEEHRIMGWNLNQRVAATRVMK